MSAQSASPNSPAPPPPLPSANGRGCQRRQSQLSSLESQPASQHLDSGMSTVSTPSTCPALSLSMSCLHFSPFSPFSIHPRIRETGPPSYPVYSKRLVGACNRSRLLQQLIASDSLVFEMPACESSSDAEPLCLCHVPCGTNTPGTVQYGGGVTMPL